MNLIHFVALVCIIQILLQYFMFKAKFILQQAEKRNPNLLSFTDNISVLEDAAK